MRSPLSRMSAAAGFTLVELLLALTLMSMLLALAYGGLRASTRATDKGQAILEDSGRIRMAHQFVRKQLNQMAPLAFAENEEDGGRTVFEGDSTSIRYVAPMPGYLGFGGPQVQELTLISGDDGYALVLSHALLKDFEEANLYVREPIMLLEKIESAEFSFLSRDETGEIVGWADRWMDPGILPEAVSLDIEFTEDIYIQWPLLTATVRVDPTALDNLAGSATGSQDYKSTVREMIDKRGSRE
jgi:general secretion pathway protein J